MVDMEGFMASESMIDAKQMSLNRCFVITTFLPGAAFVKNLGTKVRQPLTCHLQVTCSCVAIFAICFSLTHVAGLSRLLPCLFFSSVSYDKTCLCTLSICAKSELVAGSAVVGLAYLQRSPMHKLRRVSYHTCLCLQCCFKSSLVVFSRVFPHFVFCWPIGSC